VARTDSDLATAVGRGIRGRGPDAHVILLNGQANLSGALAGPVVQLLAQTAGPVEVETIQAGAWPERLPNPVRVLVAPEDLELIPTFHARYPGGQWQVIRNLYANPLLYIYDLPPLAPAGAGAPAGQPASPFNSPAGPDAAPRDP
ncbi:MAG TPA: hypothetical protein VNK95_06405, partial [Caldilineaceae bacterium]|nr:hypothetical protein [Caldilineaceae bacterium]